MFYTSQVVVCFFSINRIFCFVVFSSNHCTSKPKLGCPHHSNLTLPPFPEDHDLQLQHSYLSSSDCLALAQLWWYKAKNPSLDLNLGGGFPHPENWGWTQFDEHTFQRGWFNHQLVNHVFRSTLRHHGIPFFGGRFFVKCQAKNAQTMKAAFRIRIRGTPRKTRTQDTLPWAGALREFAKTPKVNRKDKTQYLGKINLIDLAGSENVNKSGVQGTPGWKMGGFRRLWGGRMADFFFWLSAVVVFWHFWWRMTGWWSESVALCCVVTDHFCVLGRVSRLRKTASTDIGHELIIR